MIFADDDNYLYETRTSMAIDVSGEYMWRISLWNIASHYEIDGYRNRTRFPDITEQMYDRDTVLLKYIARPKYWTYWTNASFWRVTFFTRKRSLAATKMSNRSLVVVLSDWLEIKASDTIHIAFFTMLKWKHSAITGFVTAGATCRARTAYHSRGHELISVLVSFVFPDLNCFV